MPRLLMTAKFVKTVKPPATGQMEYHDTKERGLVLRVGATRKKTWCYIYRMPGSRRLRRLTIDEVLTLKQARDRVAGLRAQVKNTRRDPAAQLEESKTIDTFEAFALFYQKKTASKKSKAEEARVIKKELLPHWRDRKLNEITRADVRTLLRGIADRPAPVMSNRVLALISTMFNLAISEDVPGITSNPAARLPKPGGEETSRDRVLSPPEIRCLWTVLEAAQHPPRVTDVDSPSPPISTILARGLQFLLVTGQRPGEVFGMKWEHLSADGTWWDLPRTLTKNGNPHRVPLTKTAQRIIADAKADAPEGAAYVFVGHMSPANSAKRCATVLSGWAPLGFAFHRHDLRRTVGTGMAEEHVSTETIARVLNHVDHGPRATRVYDRYSHDPEKRIALEAWERRLDAILAARDQGRVVPFARA